MPAQVHHGSWLVPYLGSVKGTKACLCFCGAPSCSWCGGEGGAGRGQQGAQEPGLLLLLLLLQKPVLLPVLAAGCNQGQLLD